jgi:SAM-dependent methyltransferase
MDPYAPLAPFYDDAGFSAFSDNMTPRLLTFIQERGWIGRRILDLCCGTGTATAFLAERSMEVYGIDRSEAMLKIANMRVMGTGYEVHLQQGDITTIDYPDDIDLVYCVGNSLNELRSLKELEAVFSKAYAALKPERMFVFDMTTIYGLAEQIGSVQMATDVSDRLFLAMESQFNYDSISLRQQLTLFSQTNSDLWQRDTTALTLRSYPFLAIVRLLEKIGFDVKGAFDTRLNGFDPNNDVDGKFILVAERPT